MDAAIDPNRFGLSSERLQRLGDHLRYCVDQKEIQARSCWSHDAVR